MTRYMIYEQMGRDRDALVNIRGAFINNINSQVDEKITHQIYFTTHIDIKIGRTKDTVQHIIGNNLSYCK